MNDFTYVYIGDASPLYDDCLFSKAYNSVSEKRKQSVQRFIMKKDKCLSLTAELLLRYGLKKSGFDESLISKIKTNEYGKPYFDKTDNLYFNLSHSESLALCVISGRESGCDIEKVKQADLKLAQRFFTKDEYEYLLNANPENQNNLFFRLWTLKESFIKAVGKGLTIPLNSFSVLSPKITYLENEYYFKEFDEIDGYKISLCQRGEFNKAELNFVNIKEFLE